jgi:hypothetical protein
MNAKGIVESVFSVPIAKRVWTANVDSLLPVTLQNFAIGAVMPAVLYMFRWGHRRGQGKFQKVFGAGSTKPKIVDITAVLTAAHTEFSTFDSEVKRRVLGDLLLSYRKQRTSGGAEH